MPEIADALKKEWEEAYGKGITTDPKEGQHANPFPPPAPPNPPPEPPNKSPFPPELTVEQNRADFEEALRNDVAGDEGDARRRYYDSVEREMRSRDMQADIIRKAKDATSHLFSENFGDNGIPALPWTWDLADAREEKRQMTAINKTIEAAVKSGDPAQFNAAKEAEESLSRYGKDEKTGKTYNKDDTFNFLAEFSGDIIKMLEALRNFIKETEGATDRMNNLEGTLELK
jgi:hypothetical protein